jgi:hypothetical protein
MPPGGILRIVNFLPRRAIGLVLVVCLAATPSLLLACAAICMPGMMTHGAMSAAPDAPIAQATGHDEHMHHAMPGGESPAQTASQAADASTVAAANLAGTSTDLVGPGCCAHTRATATTATPANREDTAVLLGAALAAPVIPVAAIPDVSLVRAPRIGRSLPSRPPQPLFALRI